LIAQAQAEPTQIANAGRDTTAQWRETSVTKIQ